MRLPIADPPGPSLGLTRTLLFAAGFLVWTLLSPTTGLVSDRSHGSFASYIVIGWPLLIWLQANLAYATRVGVFTAPLWTIAGHVLAMGIFHLPGKSANLWPLSLLFTGLPSYVVLMLAGDFGRRLANRTNEPEARPDRSGIRIGHAILFGLGFVLWAAISAWKVPLPLAWPALALVHAAVGYRTRVHVLTSALWSLAGGFLGIMLFRPAIDPVQVLIFIIAPAYVPFTLATALGRWAQNRLSRPRRESLSTG